jgi:predicted ATPase
VRHQGRSGPRRTRRHDLHGGQELGAAGGAAEAETRFFMLSTIREYALERLAESDDESVTRRAHAAYYLVLAEEGAEDAVAHPEWLDRFEVEHDNFRWRSII